MLSILIPSYNHARYVTETIASARKINVSGKRIVIIDDASTDGSADVIRDYLRQEGADDVDFIHKPVNRGAIDSVITFLSMCRTEYVYFMASDDVAIAQGVEALVATLEAKRSLQFVIGGGMNAFPDGSTTPIYGRKHERLFGHSPDKMLRSLFLVDPSPLLCQSSVFRLSAIQAVGGFDPALIADDYALFARLFTAYRTRGVSFEFLPSVACVLYRHHGSNSYRNLPRQAFSHRQVIMAIAPTGLRARAAGYKLAYFALVAFRRLDFGVAVQMARMATPRQLPWFAVGLIANYWNWLRGR